MKVLFWQRLGTRLAEETGIKPKPMIEIGGRPILWHIMKICALRVQGILCCARYKGEIIKRFFMIINH